MIILPENFTTEKYGLKTRLVNEDDAEFIVSLRSDAERTKYMVTLDKDLEKQKQWIRDYKLREQCGLDYYLIYNDMHARPVGVNRISKINFGEKSCKASGWIKRKEENAKAAAMFLIHNTIIFDILELDFLSADMNEKNTKVLRYYEPFDYEIIKVVNNFIYFKLTKTAFKYGLQKFINNTLDRHV